MKAIRSGSNARGAFTSDLATLSVAEALPRSRFSPDGGEGLFRRLRRAVIVRMGSTYEDANLEGGGLILDYVTESGRGGRVVFAFNENGMWIEHDTLDPVRSNLQDGGSQDRWEIG
jgi:hypothetical protein